MDINRVSLAHKVKQGLQLWPFGIFAADFFGKPFVDVMLLQGFNLPCFVLLNSGDADIGNIHCEPPER